MSRVGDGWCASGCDGESTYDRFTMNDTTKEVGCGVVEWVNLPHMTLDLEVRE